ncbi:hypothetical protein WJX73_003007 [Symbiochloris irregularis]|uniref:Protein kinase domain-containing protein n=1 Tax=Symbiochloris irregularis TaxID=706552 RepID=A0AAW1PVF8_9CHLO
MLDTHMLYAAGSGSKEEGIASAPHPIQPDCVLLNSPECTRVTCLLVLPPAAPDTLAQVWVAENHGGERCFVAVYDPPREEAPQRLGPLTSCVTCMDVDNSGRVLLAHMDGSVSVCGRDSCQTLCSDLKVFDCPVTALAVDVHGAVWVASQEGSIKILEAISLRRQAGLASLNLSVRHQLTVVSEGWSSGPPKSEDAGEAQLVHGGPIAVIQMYNFRCWTAGGTCGSCSIMEWGLRGRLRATQDVTHAGPVTAMTVLPQDSTDADADQAEHPFSGGTFSSKQDSSEAFGDWRLVSAHSSGTVLLWAAHAEEQISLLSTLQPECGPCWSVTFLESLNLWCAGYNNGKVLVQDLSAMLHLQQGGPDIEFLRFQAHAVGLTAADCSDQVLVTAGKDARVRVWTMSDMAAQDSKQPLMPGSLSGGSSLPSDVPGTNSCFRQELLDKYFTPANTGKALQAVQRALDGETPLSSWLQDSAAAKLGTPDGSTASTMPSTISTGMQHSDASASGGRAMNLLTDIMRLMHPSPSGSQYGGELHAISQRRRSSLESTVADHLAGLSADEASDPANTTRPLSSNSSAAGRRVTASTLQGQSDSLQDHSGDGSSQEPLSSADLSTRRTLSEAGHSQWLLSVDQLDIVRKVAQGSIGEVYLARYQETDVAVKALRGLEELQRLVSMAPGDCRSNPMALKSWLITSDAVTHSGSAGMMQSLEREVGILASIRHPNVVLFMGMVLDPPLIVSEWCSRGSVLDILSKAAKNPRLAAQLTWQRRLHMALDAAKGVYQLHRHKPKIIHADLKSPNLVVDANWRVKVTDFNLSRVVGEHIYSTVLVANNPRWQAPEAVASHTFTEASDVFSFGVVLWELHTMQVPWNSLNPFQIMTALQKRQRLDLPDPTPAEEAAGQGPLVRGFTELISQCWAQDPSQRPAMPTVIAHLRSLHESCRSGNAPATPCLKTASTCDGDVITGQRGPRHGTADSEGQAQVLGGQVPQSPFDDPQAQMPS